MVVGVGLLGLAKLQSGIFLNVGESRVQIAALHFAQQKLESLRGFSTCSQLQSFLPMPMTLATQPVPIIFVLALTQRSIGIGRLQIVRRHWLPLVGRLAPQLLGVIQAVRSINLQ